MLMATPLVSSFGASLLLGENLTLIQWAGGAVLLVGSTLAITAQSHLAPHHVPTAADIPTD